MSSKGTRKTVRHAENPEVRWLDADSRKEYKELKKTLTTIQEQGYRVKKINKLMEKLDMEFPKKKQSVRKAVIEQLSRDGVKSDDKQPDNELFELALDQSNRLYSQIQDVNAEIDSNQGKIRDILRNRNSATNTNLPSLEAENRRLYKAKREMSEQLVKYGELTNDLEETYESLADEIQHHSEHMLTPLSPNISPTSPRTLANTAANQNRTFKYRNQRSDILKSNIGGKTRRRRRRK